MTTTTERPWQKQTIAHLRREAEARGVDVHGLRTRKQLWDALEAATEAAYAETIQGLAEPTVDPDYVEQATAPDPDDACPGCGRIIGPLVMHADDCPERVSEIQDVVSETALVPTRTVFPTPGEWTAMETMAATLIGANMVRAKKLNTAADVVLILLAARDLNIKPTMALQRIHVIDGKPSLGGEMMVALVRRAGFQIIPVEMTSRNAKVRGVRGDESTMVEFTIDDAQLAGLVGKDNWQHYPKMMCYWRAVSMVCRIMFPDVLAGLTYTPEELGAPVDERGEVIDADSWEGSYGGADDTGVQLLPLDEDEHDGSGVCCIAVIKGRIDALSDEARAACSAEWMGARREGVVNGIKHLTVDDRSMVDHFLREAEASMLPPCDDDAIDDGEIVIADSDNCAFCGMPNAEENPECAEHPFSVE